MSVRATVRRGRLTLDEPTDLPEGAVVDLVIDDESDDLDDAGRAALHRAIGRSLGAAARGETAPAELLVERLRARAPT